MRALAVLFATTLLGGCATDGPVEPQPGEVAELEELRAMSVSSLDEAIDEARDEGGALAGIRDVGLTTGIHHGRAWRQDQINGWLESLHEMLSVTFNFEQVLIDGIYLPPRVDSIEGHVERTSEGDLRQIRQGFRIVSAPTLVVTPPTYRNYLYQVPDPIEPINRLGLPQRGTKEVGVWQHAVGEGWLIGVEQADREARADMAVLARDFGGMLRYIDLVTRGLINAPVMSSENLGFMISADGKVLNVGDEIISIDVEPSFQHHERWKIRGDTLE